MMDSNIACDEDSNKHATRIGIQHGTRIRIQHVMRIRIPHVTRISIQHGMRIGFVQGDDSEGGWRGRSGHHSVPIRMPVLKEAKDIQGINSEDSHNDNMTSDFSTPQFHALCLVCEYNCS